jgi:hypothetical protein
MGTHVRSVAVLGLSVLSFTSIARATIGAHNGIANPLDEGFTPAYEFGASESFDSNDNGSGFAAWQIAKSIPSLQKGYEYILNNSEIQEANDIGWFVRARVRVANLNDAPDYSVSVLYSNGLKRFDLVLGSDSAGDPIAKLVDFFTGDGQNATGPTFTLTGGGSGFHVYEMYFDPTANGVDLFIDGVERMSNFAGNNVFVPSPRLDFGAFGQEGTGDGRYNEVAVALTPEPSAAVLSAIAAIPLLKRRRTPR